MADTSKLIYWASNACFDETFYKRFLTSRNLRFRTLGVTWNEWDPTENAFECPELEDDELLSKIEVMFADVPIITKYRHRLRNVKWIHTAWNGVDSLTSAIYAAAEPPPTFTLTKTPGVLNAPLMSEYVIGYVIATERELLELKKLQDKSEWGQMKFGKSRKLRNITIGFLGTGAIADYAAQQCKALGMTVWGLSRRQKQDKDKSSNFDVYKTTEDLAEFLESCDYICSVLPSTPLTRGLLSGGILEHCKHKKTVFINIGRGDVVGDDCIVQAIQNKWLSKAILDVMNTEPLPQSSPLWSLPGVIITPHISGWSTDIKHFEQVMQCFVDNYHRYINNEPLQGVLDWEQGY